MKRLLKDERGLTLIEVLVVVFVISIILAIAVPNYTKSAERAKQNLCYATQKKVEAQLELYRIDKGEGFVPGAVKVDSDGKQDAYFAGLVNEGYLKETPVCPSGGVYTIVDVGDYQQVRSSVHGHYTDETLTQ